MIRTAPLALAALLAAGCSPAEQTNNMAVANINDLVIPPDEIMNADAGDDDAGDNATGNGTIGGDGSQIELDALSNGDLASETLEGELGCSFSTDTAAPMLVAKGNVASKGAAQGVVKVAGYIERVTTPGGYDAMAKGAIFNGKGKTVQISVTGPAQGGGESPARPATLTYQRADGAERTFIGRWVCGP